MKNFFRTLTAASALALAFATGAAHADSPLNLTYSVSPDAGGLYDYTFKLTLDNHDGSWAAGQSWGWIIFADVTWPTTSPLNDFTLTSPAPAPFGGLSFSFGGHNGPSLIFVNGNVGAYTPTAVGDYLTWSGTSATDVAPGDMYFSTLVNRDGAHAADRQLANLTVSSVPEGSTPAMLAAGLGLLALAARRQRARTQR
jgi:hypothetical protein